VVEFEWGLQWRVMFPEAEHVAASGFLRDLAASDCSPGTLRSYAYDLLRWFRFLHQRWMPWEHAERSDVREFVEWLREASVPQRLNRRPDGPVPGSVNLVRGRAAPGVRYAARTINHQLSVLFGFYEWACGADLGPLINPVPAQRLRSGGRCTSRHRATTRRTGPPWSAPAWSRRHPTCR
jgi:site-specific recombinase XerD